MYVKRISIAVISLAFAGIATAQDYFDFGQIRGVPAEPAVQVDLNPMLIGLATAAARAENPAAADMIAGIDGVRVRIYTSLEDFDDVVAFVDDASDRLAREDWQRVVTVQDDGHIRIFVRGTDDAVTGVTAMLVGESEAIFVNIAGSISPEQLAQSLETFGAGDVLASLDGLDFGL